MHLVRHVLARKLGQRLGRGDLHLVVDRAGADVQRAAEDVGKAEHVVDLVRIVAAAGGDDRVGQAARASSGVISGSGLAMAKMIGLPGHAAHHVRRQRALHRQAEEHVGALDRLGQRARLGLRRRAPISTGSCPRCGPGRPRPWCRRAMTWSGRMPIAFSSSTQAMAAAPAPLTTSFVSRRGRARSGGRR